VSHPFTLLLLFVSRWNQAIFGRQFSMTPSTKRFSSIFDLGPQTPKIYSPKFAQNRLYGQLVWKIDRMFGPTSGFSGTEPRKMLWGRPCCHSNEIWAKRGDPVAYRLVIFHNQHAIVSCLFFDQGPGPQWLRTLFFLLGLLLVDFQLINSLKLFFISQPIVIKLRLQISDNIVDFRNVS